MTKINGLLASKGKVKGTVVFFHNMKDAGKVDSNSIVVADRMSKEYMEVLVKCAAFIMTHGGITSHASIVCRELKKPCIVSCSNAFDLFVEGKKILLNATELEIEELE